MALNGEDIAIDTSEDLADLNPKTTREYLMIMYPMQARMLKHLEEINGFKVNANERIGRLEAKFTVGGMIVIVALLGLALKVVFGG